MNNQKSLISHITLGVTDFSKMKDFYSGFGFDMCSESEEINHPFAMYKLGSIILALYPKHLLAEQAVSSIEDSDSNNAMSISLNVETKQTVDNYLEKAKRLGADITREGFEPAWGGYCGYFKDPETISGK